MVFPANLGSICTVAASDGTETMAEIIGFKKGNNILSMFESDTKIQSGAKVSIIDDGHDVKVGEALLGRFWMQWEIHMMETNKCFARNLAFKWKIFKSFSP